MNYYFYLHGFASSPQSAKARYVADRFTELGVALQVPDLNQGDFSHLTLTRQLQQVQALFPPEPAPVAIVGSSFGGLTAAWLGQRYSQIDRLVLLAPAFHFLDHWIPKLGEVQMQRWQQEGSLPVYHYGDRATLPLDYGFMVDVQKYTESEIQRPVPTLILHGVRDEVIPIQASRDFAASRPWVRLVELDSDHALGDAMPPIWEAIVDHFGMG
ncbi:MAG: YqiA/YcfP family alpha/beta fold hydrolase [Leptolyngbyaceae cyanobacterium bins.59]|nr:YqiA/YcfP family alpha/beta fold hydrolase [Leptolyngbyaceae cyanobacterium bins.59]